MPYTTLAAGAPILSSWANENVRDQVVTPFATQAARDAAITAPIEGMTVYIEATNRYMTYTGSSWRVCATDRATIAGTHSDTHALSAADTGTISFGLSFVAAPVVVGTLEIGSNVDGVLNWTSPPGVSSVPFRVASNNGGVWAESYKIHWIAVGILAVA